MKPSRSISLRTLCVAASLLASQATLSAATVTKSSSGTDLNAGATWGGSAPGSGDVATWSTGSLGGSLTLGTNISWQGISIVDATADISVTGAGALTLGSSGITIAQSAKNLTIANSINTLATSQTWNIGSGRSLSLSSTVGLADGTTLSINGAGTITISGDFYTGGVGAAGSNTIVNQSNGTLNLDKASGTIRLGHWPTTGNQYNLSGGTLNVLNTTLHNGWDGANAFNISGGTANLKGLGMNGNSNSSSLTLSGGRLNIGSSGIAAGAGSGARTINLGAGTVGAFGGNWSAGIGMNLTGTGANAVVFDTLDSNNGTTARTITLNGGLYGTGGLVKNGAGTLVFAARNTFSGGVTINAGTVQVSAGTNWVDSTMGTGDITVNGGKLQATSVHVFGWNANTWNNISVGDTGVFDIGGYDNYIGALTLTDNASVTGNSGNYVGLSRGTLSYSGSSATKQATISSQLALASSAGGSGDTTFTIGGTNVTSGDLAVTGVIKGGGKLTKEGAGILVMSGANNYTGGTLLNAGTIRLNYAESAGVSGPLGASGTITLGGGTLQYTANNTYDYSARFNHAAASQRYNVDTNGQSVTWGTALTSSGGSLAKSGNGTLKLTANATFSGGITITGGTLQAGSSPTWGVSTMGTGAISVTNGTLQALNVHLFGWSAGTFNNITLNDGGVFAIGSNDNYIGTLTLADNASITGTGYVGLSSGVLSYTGSAASKQATIGSKLSLASPVGGSSGDTTFTIGGTNATSGDVAVTGVVQGGGKLTKAGAGILVMSGANTYTGGTALNAGTIRLNYAESAGTSGPLGASGTITLGGGTLQYTGNNTYDYSGRFSSGANQQYKVDTNSQNATWGTALTSSGGSLTKSGNGTLTLSKVNTYNGATTVNGGTLSVTGSIASSAATVASGAILAGTGTAGNVTVSSGGILSPGVSNAGTLTVGDLTFSGTGNITLGILAGAINSTVQVNGQLVANGGAESVTFALGSSLATLSSGTYSLLAYTGTQLSDVAAFTYSGTRGARQGVSVTNGTKAINLVVTSTYPIWTGANSDDFSAAIGAGTTNWKLSGGGAVDAAFITNDSVRFDSTASRGTVNLTADVATASVVFEGDSLNYTLGSTGNFKITAGQLTKSGNHNLTINNANTYAGGTVITGSGTLTLGNGGALGSGSVSLNGGTLAIGGNSVGNDISLGGGSISGAGTLTGVLSGGSLVKSDNTTLTLTNGSNAQTGTTLSAGKLQVGADGALGSGASLTLNGGTLSSDSTTARAITAAGSSTIGGNITLGDATNTGALTLVAAFNLGGSTRTVTTASNATLSGALTNGSLTKAGNGTLTLSNGSNSLTATTVSQGTLVATNNSAFGNGTLTLGDANTGSAGAKLLIAAGGFGKAISISSASSAAAADKVLTFGANGATGLTEVTGLITLNNHDLVIDGGVNTDRFTLQGGITGTGNLAIAGSGVGANGVGRVLFLSVANTFTGNLTVQSGAMLQLDYGTSTTTSYIPDAAIVTVDGILKIAKGNNSETIGGLAGSGELYGHDAFSNTATRLIIDSTTTNTFSGKLTNGGASGATLALTKQGVGTQVLNGANTYTGGTSLTAGVLEFADGSLGPSGTVAVSNATLRWASGNTQDISSRLSLSNGTTATLDTNGNNVTFAAAVGNSTTAKLAKAGSGKLTLSASPTHSGNTDISGGTLELGASARLGSGGTYAGDIAFSNNASLRLLSTANQVLSGALSGAGSLDKSGTGTLTLSNANNTYTGGTTLSNGTLNIKHASALGSGGLTINGGTLDNTSTGALTLANNLTQAWNGNFTFAGTQNLDLGGGAVTLGGNRQVTVEAGNLTVGGAIGGAYSLAKAGAGALTLSGANTYSGGTTLSAGQLNLNSSTALGAMAGTFTLAGGTIDNTSGSAVTLANNNAQAWNGDFTFAGSSDLNLGSGDVALGGNRQVTVSSHNLTVGGVISGAYSLTKLGAGTLTLNGANTYSGGTTVSEGILVIGSAGSLGSVGSVDVLSGATLNLAGYDIGRSINVASGGILLGVTNYSGDITATNGLSLGAANAGFTGTVTVNGGILAIGAGNALGSGSAAIADGAVIDLAGHNLGNAGLTLAGTGILNGGAMVNNSGAAASHSGAIALSSSASIGGSGDITLGGVISGAGNGLTKVGVGTLTLSGTNTYTGTTAVEAGKLVIDGTVAGAVTVASGAVLGGHGTINGNLTVDGAHKPGNSPGVETVNGDVIYNDGASVEWELWGNTTTQTSPTATFDQIVITGAGNLTFNGTVSLTLRFNTSSDTGTSAVDWNDNFWQTYHTWKLFDLSTGSIAGASNLTLAGASLYKGYVMNGAYTDKNNVSLRSVTNLADAGFYLQQVGQDLLVTYTPVPEPSTYGLALGGLALAAAAIRRRRAAQRAARA